MTAGPDLFARCVAAVSQQAETELERRGVTLETADQWEQITYAEDLMTFAGDVLYKVECRARDGSDGFCVEAVLNDGGTVVDIVVTAQNKGRASDDNVSSGELFAQ